jgi:hypothetical protein
MVLASKMRMEISVRDTPLIPAVPFRPALYLPLRPSPLMAFLFPFLRLFHVRPLLRLLHLPVVLPRLRMPISTLRFLIATVIIAMIFRFCLFFRRSLLLPILRLRSVLILRDGHPRRSQQQRSANPTHD